VMFC